MPNWLKSKFVVPGMVFFEFWRVMPYRMSITSVGVRTMVSPREPYRFLSPTINPWPPEKLSAPPTNGLSSPQDHASSPVERVLFQAIAQAGVQAVPAEILRASQVIVVSLVDVERRIVRQRIVTEHLLNVRIGIGNNRIR